MTAALTKARVLHRDAYELADRGAFEILFESMTYRKAKLVTGAANLIGECPSYHQIFWRADMSTITEGVDPSARVMASVLVHQGAHSLAAIALGEAIHRDPCLALAGEALASALNIYFAFEIMHRSGTATEAAVAAYAAPRTPVAAKRALGRAYAKFPADRVRLVRGVTIEIWALYRAMHEIDSNEQLDARGKLRAVKAHIKRMAYPWLVTRLDITNNYLFAKASYPLRLTPARLDTAARHLDRWFDAATSVADVLARMRAPAKRARARG